MRNIVISGTTPPQMAQAIMDGALIAENTRLREELRRMTDERDLLLWARQRENAQKLAEIREYCAPRPTLLSRLRVIGAAIARGLCATATMIWSAIHV